MNYSDSDESETDTPFQPPPPPDRTYSTLFPPTRPIDVKDFETDPETVPSTGDNQEDPNFSKAFQRKKRIGVALVNTVRKLGVEEERKGLGFSETTSGVSKNVKSGGVMFVKGDVLNPEPSPVIGEEKWEGKISKDIEETYVTLKEKLGFLGEGRGNVSPVQVMLIQIEVCVYL